MRLLRFDGHILGASFTSGDTIVAGRWHGSPFGPFADVMWARPDGRRTLFAPSTTVASYVTAHYAFDDVVNGPVTVERHPDGAIRADAGAIALRLEPRRRTIASMLLALRPRVLRENPRWIAVEDTIVRPLVSPLFGAAAVQVRGTTRAGAREWYAIHDVVPAWASAAIGGIDAGPLSAARRTPAGFGFSEFPSVPSIVRVTSLIEAG